MSAITIPEPAITVGPLFSVLTGEMFSTEGSVFALPRELDPEIIDPGERTFDAVAAFMALGPGETELPLDLDDVETVHERWDFRASRPDELVIGTTEHCVRGWRHC